MITYEEVIKAVEAEIQMYETMRTELVQKLNDAQNDDREWRQDRSIEFDNSTLDHQLIVDDYFFSKIKDAKERLADAQKKLLETQVVTEMSAGVSLLEQSVPKWHGITIVDGEMVYGNGQKVKRVSNRKAE